MKCPYCGAEVDLSVQDDPDTDWSAIKCRRCGNWLERPEPQKYQYPVSAHMAEGPLNSMGSSPDPSLLKKMSKRTKVEKYFLHGLCFSALMFVIVIGWVFILAFLMAIGSFIGLIIGIVILLYLVGWLNISLNKYFWNYNASSETMGILLHGLILMLALVVVGIPQLIWYSIFPNPLNAIWLFIVYCFIDGYVAKMIGKNF
jgi:hypothetical protein